MRGMKGLVYETSVLDPDEVRDFLSITSNHWLYLVVHTMD